MSTPRKWGNQLSSSQPQVKNGLTTKLQKLSQITVGERRTRNQTIYHYTETSLDKKKLSDNLKDTLKHFSFADKNTGIISRIFKFLSEPNEN